MIGISEKESESRAVGGGRVSVMSAMVRPSVDEPVSPIYRLAGCAFSGRNPRRAKKSKIGLTPIPVLRNSRQDSEMKSREESDRDVARPSRPSMKL